MVAAIDANGDAVEGVQEFVKHMDLTYPVGLEDETTPTYAAFTDANFQGANPFPVDIVVGRDGLIKYISREYDPDGLTAAVEAALADEG